MKMSLLVVISLSFFQVSFGQGPQPPQKIIYKYKKYEKFNLGDMSIKGDVITPGDISVKQRKFKRFSEGLFHRWHFRDMIKEDIRDIR